MRGFKRKSSFKYLSILLYLASLHKNTPVLLWEICNTTAKQKLHKNKIKEIRERRQNDEQYKIAMRKLFKMWLRIYQKLN